MWTLESSARAPSDYRNALLETLVVKLRLDSLGLELRIGAEKNRGSLMKKYPKLEKVFHPSRRRA